MDTVKATLEIIYLLNDVFYGYEDFKNWPDNAKLFYSRVAALIGGIIVETNLTPEQLKRIIEESDLYEPRRKN